MVFRIIFSEFLVSDKKLVRKTDVFQQNSISPDAKQPSAGGHLGFHVFQSVIQA